MCPVCSPDIVPLDQRCLLAEKILEHLQPKNKKSESSRTKTSSQHFTPKMLFFTPLLKPPRWIPFSYNRPKGICECSSSCLSCAFEKHLIEKSALLRLPRRPKESNEHTYITYILKTKNPQAQEQKLRIKFALQKCCVLLHF